MPILSSLLLINPEIEKHSFLNKKNVEVENVFKNEEIFDLKDTYAYLVDSSYGKGNDVKNHIFELFESTDEDSKISHKVLNQCYSLLDSLYPSIVENINFENIYSTPYGTVVFDWEKDSQNVFSLEVGSDKLGYFIEIDGRDIKQIDSFDLKDSKSELLKELSDFLQD